METNDYCSYELSKQLKECGFDEPCDHYYTNGYVNNDPEDISRVVKLNNGTVYNHNKVIGADGEHISAPLLYHAQKWLREKHKLHILVDSDLYDKWYYKVFPIGECCIDEGNSNYVTYEQALSAGIESALQLIEKGE